MNLFESIPSLLTGIVIGAAIAAAIYWIYKLLKRTVKKIAEEIDEIHNIPLRFVGLKSIPGVPIELDGVLDSGFKLLGRLAKIVRP